MADVEAELTREQKKANSARRYAQKQIEKTRRKRDNRLKLAQLRWKERERVKEEALREKEGRKLELKEWELPGEQLRREEKEHLKGPMPKHQVMATVVQDETAREDAAGKKEIKQEGASITAEEM
ncbi:hypothetical protein FPQ18DRAFT_385891 [Pyronema domesticum]|uniref:Uncharacterized protein n=1 Tax=Pyronema omphalodes (strain CBS 100304) TaxID=1076935 RepID=U4LK43_PYROM|nr:hypothetical protein FPQ18DRAFT_385891 [Pyronema domesticum]CCX13066.1 Protein of unknown function [Pyronema omphalodes CBS 100304]